MCWSFEEEWISVPGRRNSSKGLEVNQRLCFWRSILHCSVNRVRGMQIMREKAAEIKVG